MKSKKFAIVVAIALSLVTAFNSASISHATELPTQTTLGIDNPIITPYWNNINLIAPSITKSGTTIYAEAYIEAKSSSASISGTMHLDREVGPGLWASVSSWGFSGTSGVFISKSYVGTSGYTYRVRIVTTINGESATATSFPLTL